MKKALHIVTSLLIIASAICWRSTMVMAMSDFSSDLAYYDGVEHSENTMKCCSEKLEKLSDRERMMHNSVSQSFGDLTNKSVSHFWDSVLEMQFYGKSHSPPLPATFYSNQLKSIATIVKRE